MAVAEACFFILLCVASPNIPRHAPVRNARPRPLAAGGLASLEPRRRFRRHPPQRALPVAECGALYAAPVFGGGRGPLALVQARPVRSDAWVS